MTKAKGAPKKTVLFGIGAAIILLLLTLVIYQVDSTEYAVVTQFGQPVRVVEDAGLKIKLPDPIQSVQRLDKRVQVYQTSSIELLTLDRLNVSLDYYGTWKIVDPILFLQTVRDNTFPFRQIRNTGQKPQYFVEDSHPAIVSQEDFQRVRELMARRREQFLSHAQRRPSVYSRRVFCGVCGSMCRRKDIRGKVYWVCHRHDQEKSRCPVPQVPEAEITSAVLRLYHKLAQDPARIFRPMAERLRELRELELRSNRKITDIDKEIARLSEQNLVLVRLKSKGYVDPALYLSQQDEITHKLKELKKLRRRALEASGEDQQLQNTEAILEYLEDSGRPFQRETVDEELFEFLIQRLTVYSAETVKFRLYNGLELAETMERAVR